MNDSEILCYLAIDKPQNCVQYGEVVAKPIAKSCLENILPMLNIEIDESLMEGETVILLRNRFLFCKNK